MPSYVGRAFWVDRLHDSLLVGRNPCSSGDEMCFSLEMRVRRYAQKEFLGKHVATWQGLLKFETLSRSDIDDLLSGGEAKLLESKLAKEEKAKVKGG